MMKYDEFSMFGENISEYGLKIAKLPSVSRIAMQLEDGRTLSALKWGSSAPEVLFVHGSAQNAHTWDTVILAMGISAIAIDMPGHGHSSWRKDGNYEPGVLAHDVATAIETWAPQAKLIVGMSLGGLTTVALAGMRPDLAARIVVVDITPGVNSEKSKAITDFVNGPQSFASFEELLKRTIEHNPTRSESSLRRGILHNAKQLDDGSWQWRYDRSTHPSKEDSAKRLDRISELWTVIANLESEMTLVRGGISPVVDDADVAELRRRKPGVEVVVIDGAGHSVQGDRPVELAEVLTRILRR
ncbi:MAG: alpha/beta hydrolase [Acidimicrobiia bacterium]|nr:alpha/beta hydrolase [Actinomycetota bacterium]NDA37328.1 alpha/beta hydrolase [Acidimicrobiia bacterium]NDC91592.1 alpha/beta hydrolase [Acidimicrobiia bacterium]NDD71941.1 alpha/beta hydrolase [Actinomycetota bacterium]